MNDLIDIFTGRNYILPLLVGIGTYLLLWVVKNVLIERLKRICAHTETFVDDIILSCLERTRHIFILAVSVFMAIQGTPLDKKYGHIADKVFYIILGLQAIMWGIHAINQWIDHTIVKKGNDPALKTSLGFAGLLVKIFFLVAIFLFVLNNLGVNVSTFIAGLGVGGIAIALATQNILGDLFSSLSIVIDKPFIVGDFISLGEWLGTIEHVGLKTTRLRSLSGEQVIISNTDLLNSKIRNFKRMTERRVVFQVGVTYQTKREDLARAASVIEAIIRKENLTRFDRSHFINYGPSSLDIETVYFVLSPDFNVYRDIHQRILLALHEAFEQNDLDFAYPTQTVFLKPENRLQEQLS